MTFTKSELYLLIDGMCFKIDDLLKKQSQGYIVDEEIQEAQAMVQKLEQEVTKDRTLREDL